MEHDRNNEVFAKQLRKNMTPWERKLWYLFLKNYPIRFCNKDIDKNFYGVCTVIDEEVKKRI